MTFLPLTDYQNLLTQLTDAAGHPLDPEARLGEILAPYLAPEGARADIEEQDRLAA